jgi:hypothetical protein
MESIVSRMRESIASVAEEGGAVWEEEMLLPVDPQYTAKHYISSPYASKGYPWFSPLAP